MESVTVLSLLSTVMQVLSYGSGLISLSRRELKDGSTDSTLDDNKIYFEALISILEEKLAEADGVASSPGDGRKAELDSSRRRAVDTLRSLASDLLRDSRALDIMLKRVVEIIDLAGLARMAAIARFRVFHQSDIIVLERRLNVAREVLNAEFLTGLWYVLTDLPSSSSSCNKVHMHVEIMSNIHRSPPLTADLVRQTRRWLSLPTSRM
jgi:hypothetical protein